MVEDLWLDKRMAEMFHQQASTLLALITSENNRLFNEAKSKDAEEQAHRRELQILF